MENNNLTAEDILFDGNEGAELGLRGRLVNEFLLRESQLRHECERPDLYSNSESYRMKLFTEKTELMVELGFPDGDQECEELVTNLLTELEDFPFWNKNNRMREEDWENVDVEMGG